MVQEVILSRYDITKGTEAKVARERKDAMYAMAVCLRMEGVLGLEKILQFSCRNREAMAGDKEAKYK